ncbi:hypothetical protein GCM10027038_16530 [Arthrobacter bambusae]
MDEDRIKFPVKKFQDPFPRRRGFDVYFRPGPVRTKTAEQGCKQRVCHPYGYAQFERAALGTADLFHCCQRGIVSLNDVLRFLLKAAAGICERNVVVCSVEEPEPERFFQSLEFLAQRGLGDVEPDGGFAEVQFLGQHKESPELADLHVPS